MCNFQFQTIPCHLFVLQFQVYCSVPQIQPPFCNLSLSTKCMGGLICRMQHFLSQLHPSAVPHNCVKRDLIVGEGWGRARNMRRREIPNASGRLVSFSVEGRGSRVLPQSSWRVHHYSGRSMFAIDTLTRDSRVAWSQYFEWDEQLSLLLEGGGEGFMLGIKILCGKKAGGLMREGGIFVEHYGIWYWICI